MLFDDVKTKLITLAKEMKHEYVIIEHLLSVLINDYEETKVTLTEIAEINVDNLEEVIQKNLDSLAKTEGCFEPKFGVDVRRVFQLATQNTQTSFSIQIADLIFAYATVVLEDITDGNSDSILLTLADAKKLEKRMSQCVFGEKVESDSDYWAKDSVDKKLYDEVEPTNFKLVGLTDEFKTLIHAIGQEKNALPIVVGDSFTGKSSLITALVNFINDDSCPKNLKGKKVLRINTNRMVSNDHQRINIQTALKSAERNNAILAIEDCHGFAGYMADDGVGLLLSQAAKSGAKIICTVDSHSYSRLFEKQSVSQSVTKIVIGKQSPENVKTILQTEVDHYSHVYELSFDDKTLDSCVSIAQKERNGSLLQNASFVLNRAASISLYEKKDTVSEEAIRKAHSEIKGIASENLSLTDNDKVMNLEDRIKKNIFGQDKAINSIAEAVKVSKMGFKENPFKPNGIFMMLGSTGVGKTELSKQVAKELGVELIRLDMSEYQESHTVSKLLGAPAGYAGYNDGDGALYEKLLKHPDAVVLFDEIEKAHPSIYNLLLGAMDHGVLTTSTNKTVNFKDAFIFFTSNVGVQASTGTSFGLAEQTTEKVEISKAAYEAKFSSEFRNRIDYLIEFDTLGKESAKMVADKVARNVAKSLKESRGIELVVDDLACGLLVDQYYSLADGARQISRGFRSGISIEIMNRMMKLKTIPSSVIVSAEDKQFVYKFK